MLVFREDSELVPTFANRVEAAMTSIGLSTITIRNLSLNQPSLPTPILIFPFLKPQFLYHPSLHKAAIFLTPDSGPKFLIRASMAETPSPSITKPFSVLFVCLGNICRSPAAEGVFTDLVTKKGLNSKFKIDSAGTINYHEGNQADPRMRATAKTRGIQITSLSRPIRPSDFRDFDLIIAMDKQNREDILGALERWRFRETLPPDAHKKVRLMCSYCKRNSETEVPDPYYGGQKGFEKVLDLLEDACSSLLESILAEIGQKDS